MRVAASRRGLHHQGGKAWDSCAPYVRFSDSRAEKSCAGIDAVLAACSAQAVGVLALSSHPLASALVMSASLRALPAICTRVAPPSPARRRSQPRAVTHVSRCMAAAVPEGHPRRASDWLELDGKVALITGGASGLGSACACELARHGVKCVPALTRRRRVLVTPLGPRPDAGWPSRTCAASWTGGSRRTRSRRRRQSRWRRRTRRT